MKSSAQSWYILGQCFTEKFTVQVAAFHTLFSPLTPSFVSKDGLCSSNKYIACDDFIVLSCFLS